MPTIISHALVPLAAANGLGRSRIPGSVALAGAVLAMLPDADVIGFRLGIAYADDWGHRGATHSLVIAAVLAGLICLVIPKARTAGRFTFLFLAAASHGLLDMLTDGGLGVALLWPLDMARHFFELRPIRVSPIGAGFFTARGLQTIASELVWIWLPCALLVVGARAMPRGRR